jgi:ABC-type branched-subunit amino acid transport system ATPase component
VDAKASDSSRPPDALGQNHVRSGEAAVSLLRVAELCKSFGGVKALNGISLTVREGSITALIGPNGAGKTTLFNAICGFLPIDSGTMWFGGQRLDGLGPCKAARLGIARTFQDLRLLRRVPVLENVMLSFQHQAGEGALRGLLGWHARREEHVRAEMAWSLLEFVGLLDKSHDLGESLSYGQQKLLTVACCLAMDAKLLLLDEPVGGIEPGMSQKILDLLRQLRARGKTIFLIEHNIEAVKEVSDTVVVLDEGRRIAEGPPGVVMQDPVVLEAYLR